MSSGPFTLDVGSAHCSAKGRGVQGDRRALYSVGARRLNSSNQFRTGLTWPRLVTLGWLLRQRGNVHSLSQRDRRSPLKLCGRQRYGRRRV